MKDAEIRTALREDAPLPEEVEDIVRAAMARASRDETATRLPILAIAATLLLVIGAYAYWDYRRQQVADEGEAAVERQRAANEAFLKSADARQRLDAQEKGTWIVVVGGDTMLAGPDLDPLLAKAARARPKARHRFVFRKGQEGERTYQITFGDAPWAGVDFMAAAGVDVGSGSTFMRNGKRASFPGPDLRPWLPLHLSVPGREEEVEEAVVLSTGSQGPLLLPTGPKPADGGVVEALSPLAEIPGTAKLVSVAGELTGLRRHLVRVRVPELDLDEALEAVAVRGIGDRVAGGVTWHYAWTGYASRDPLPRAPTLLISGDWFRGIEDKFEGSSEQLRKCLCLYVPLYVGVPAEERRAGSAHLVLVDDGPGGPAILALNEKTDPAEVRAFLERAGR